MSRGLVRLGFKLFLSKKIQLIIYLKLISYEPFSRLFRIEYELARERRARLAALHTTSTQIDIYRNI